MGGVVGGGKAWMGPGHRGWVAGENDGAERVVTVHMREGGRGKATQSRESDADEDGSAEHETHRGGIERPKQCRGNERRSEEK